MNKLLVDSDVIIEILRKNKKISDLVKSLVKKKYRILFSPVVLAEVKAGMRPREKSLTMALFDAMECVPVSKEIGEKAGEILNRFHKSHGVELGDALIAASAIIEKSELLTLNRKHYPMKELRLISRLSSIKS